MEPVFSEPETCGLGFLPTMFGHFGGRFEEFYPIVAAEMIGNAERKWRITRREKTGAI